jgi:hypothetical protein
MDPAKIADLQARIGKLPDAARAALREMWTTPNEAGENLPPVKALMDRHSARADAMVSSVESRVRSGHFSTEPAIVPEVLGDEDDERPFE